MADKETKEFMGLLSDTPFGERAGDEQLKLLEQETLGFKGYARVLAQAAVETPDPITIGVYGRWGTGKTSMMRIMHRAVKETDGAVAVWFNAWQYEREEHVIIPLTATIARALDAAELKWSEKKKKLLAEGKKQLGAAIRGILYGFSVKGKVGIPLMSEAEINLSPKDMITRYQELTQDALLSRSLYFDAFESLDKVVKNSGLEKPRIVVFVDDLDRCFPHRAVQVLESIKLVLNQPGFAFVIGVHDEIIRKFVRHKYGEKYAGEELLSNYLEKIVQVEVRVPAPGDEQMNNYIGSLLDKGKFLDPEKPEIREDVVALLRDANDRNPRAIVRMLNAALVAYRVHHKDGDLNILALLISLAVDKPQYKPLLKALGRGTRVRAGETRHLDREIGEHISDLLAGYDPKNHAVCEEKLKSSIADLPEGDAKMAVMALADSPSLCQVLATDTGLRWLSERDFREQAAKATAAARVVIPEGLSEKEKKVLERIKNGEKALEIPEVVEWVTSKYESTPESIRPYITDLRPLQKVESLTFLNLLGCTEIKDLGPIEKLTKLLRLWLDDCSGIKNLGPIEKLTELTHLRLDGCTGITDLGPIEKLTELTHLWLTGCTGITDLGPLKQLKSLTQIYINGSGVESVPEELKGKIIR